VWRIDHGRAHGMANLSTVQKIGIILTVIGVFVFVGLVLVPEVHTDSPGDCARALTVLIQDDWSYACDKAARDQLLGGALAGGFWVLIGVCLIILFPNKDT
jgi:hypothetical protein